VSELICVCVCVRQTERVERVERGERGGDRRERERERVQTPKDIYLSHGDDS